MGSKRFGDGPLGVATHAVAVTKHDSNEVLSNDNYPRGLYVGTAGDITLRAADSDTDVVFKNVPAGTTLHVSAKLVKTATTAADIVALW